MTPITSESLLPISFNNPPAAARPQTMYHWLNGNVSKMGITKDLEAMKRVGIGGILLFNTTCRIPEGSVMFGTETWYDHLAFLADEAARLGLEMTLHNSDGWSATGGPWVTPEMSMKCLVWTESQVASSHPVQLREPGVEDLKPPYTDKRNSILKNKLLFYRDIAVIAFPESVGGQAVAKADIRILTDHMQPDGTLDWQPPSGVWTVLRLGYTSTGVVSSQAASTGRGLEIDKLSRAAVDVHWEHFLDRVIDRLGSGALKYIEIDSFEKGDQNWTDGLDETFRRKLGYDPMPYLIAHAGYTVDNAGTTERFLWDFQSVVAGLMHENYFGYFREKCNAHGILFANEPFGNGPFDSATAAMIPDLPMGEYWTRNHRRGLLWQWAARIAASGARLTGKRVVGAEAQTEMSGDFSIALRDLKAKTDEFMAIGLNAFFFHTFAHQPWHDDVLPGMTMGPYGINYHRNNTWFPHSADWHTYLSRCSHVLQSGDYMADILLLDGEDSAINKIAGRLGELDPPPLDGYQIDYSSIASGILDRLQVDADGTLRVTYDGTLLANRYLFLVIRSSARMRSSTAARLGALAAQGATIFCERPVGTPSLADEGGLEALVERYWGGGLIRDPQEFVQVLAKQIPDCEVPEGVHFSRTRIGDGDYYFVANTGLRSRGSAKDLEYPYSEDGSEIRQLTARFRVSGKVPEIWNPIDGTIEEAAFWRQLGNGQTEVRMALEEAGSRFVVFRKPTERQGEKGPRREFVPIAALEQVWEVSFDSRFGPNAPVTFKQLTPWNEHHDDLIKYFSGAAVYRTRFNLGPGEAPTHLDLGRVEVLAQVTLNGQVLGTLWKPPYRVAVGDAVRSGVNELEVKVVNLWVNRLIGDAPFPDPVKRSGKFPVAFPDWLTAGQPPPASGRKTIAALVQLDGDAPLRTSGLLGPVSIGVMQSVPWGVESVSPPASVMEIFSTDFSAASQPGGSNSPVIPGGTVAKGFSVSPLIPGSGIRSMRLNDRVEQDPFVSEVAGTNPAATLEQAVATEAYFDITITAEQAADFKELGFSMRASGSGSQTAAVTVRSNVDGYASDLAAVSGAMNGKYPAAVDLSAAGGFAGLDAVTFRFYLYDTFEGQNNRFVGIDDLSVRAAPAGKSLNQ